MNRKVTIGKSLTVMAVILAVLCTVFVIMDVLACRKSNLEWYEKNAKQQLLLLTGMDSDGEADISSAALVQKIKKEFETNSKKYCIVGVEEELCFVRDDRMTEEMYDKTVTDFFGGSENRTVNRPWTETRVFPDGMEYIVAGICMDSEEGMLTVAVCAREDYVIKQGDFDVLLQRLFVYLVLTGIAYIASVSFLSGKDTVSRQQKHEMQEQLVHDRKIIERLGTKLEERNSSEWLSEEGGMCSKEILNGVLVALTPEQRKKSRKMMVYLKEKDTLMMSRISVLLDRMLKGVSVCSLWDEDCFYVLLLNTDDEAAANFAKQFIMQYQTMFRQDIRDVRAVVGKI